MKKQKILIIEDETIIALNIQNMLEMKGYEVCDIGISAEDAISLTEKHNPDLILMDIILDGEKDGVTAVEEIKKNHDISLVYLTAHSDEKTLQKAKETEPHGYIIKPISQEELLSTVEIALYKNKMERKLKESEEKYKNLFNNAEVAIFRTKLDGSAFLDMNEKFLNIIGYTREELVGRETVLNWADPEERKEMVRRLKADGRVQNYEFKLLNKNNEVRNCITSLKLYNESGIIEGSFIDITERKKVEVELKESQERYHSFMEEASDCFALFDSELNYIDINKISLPYWPAGTKKKDIIGNNIADLLPTIKESGRYNKYLEVIKTGKPFIANDTVVDPIFGKKTFMIKTFKVGNGMGHIATDITESKKAEEEILNERDNLLRVLEAMEDGVYIVNEQHDIQYLNPVLSNAFGPYKGHKCYEYFHDRQEACTWCKNKEVFNGKTVRWEFHLPKNQRTYDLIDTPIKNPDGSLSKLEIFRDITEQKKAEELTRASLKEKEILLQEIHHRVKNNMQVITSLLNLQSTRIKDDDARKQFEESENRIRSMALVHEKLYQSKDLANIDFREYVNDLTKNMCNSLSLSKNKIPVEVNIEEQYLDATRSIPCGQIITELMSNSLKHAFPLNRNGQISIGFEGDTKGNYNLTISDNGIGLPKDFDMSKTETLGLKLLEAYVKQLKGEMKVSGKKGTKVTITFPGE